jgi:toxin ParE1/3/4
MNELALDSRAERELIDALVRHERLWKQYGRSLYEEFRTAFDNIRRMPKGYPVYRKDYRFCVLPRAPYVIYFLELPGAIWIQAISHTKRRPGYWLRRKRPKGFE